MNEIIDSITKDNLYEKLEAFWHLDITEEEMDKIFEKINKIQEENPSEKTTIQLAIAKILLNHSMYCSSSAEVNQNG